ncbi:cytochrome P450 [Thozetella sp. PMI_491]|nr:cytochrome P450 [Thozetella sp. PMI_491]
MASRMFGLRGAALISAIELLAARRVIPDSLPSQGSIVSLFFTFFAFNTSLLVFWNTVIHPYFLSPVRHFPQPKGWLTRYIIPRIGKAGAPGDLFVRVAEETPNDGIVLLRLPGGVRSRLLLTKPAALADVLVHRPYDFVKFQNIRNFLRYILGDGLIIVEGEQHKFLLKNTLPAFSFRHIKDLYPMMWKKSISLTDALKAEIQEQPKATDGESSPNTIEINSWASKITLDIIGVAGLGRDFNMLKNAEDPLLKNYETLTEPTREKSFYFFLSLLFSQTFLSMLPWKMSRLFKSATTGLREICGRLVQDKRDEMAKMADGHFDILSLLLRSNNFSDNELVDQLLTFLAAGHETTSSAFTWSCYMLAKYPAIQTALRAEVRAALGPNLEAYSDADIAATLEGLPYLNGIMNETLRLYPTVPVTVRNADRDTRIMNHHIPKGTEILISPWLINRSVDLWGEGATEFKPERWIEDGKPNKTGGATSNYAQLTFLHGPRSCIGQNFAKAELRCLLAAMVSAFEWELGMKDEDVVPAGVVTIKPANGLHIKLKPITETL